MVIGFDIPRKHNLIANSLISGSYSLSSYSFATTPEPLVEEVELEM